VTTTPSRPHGGHRGRPQRTLALMALAAMLAAAALMATACSASSQSSTSSSTQPAASQTTPPTETTQPSTSSSSSLPTVTKLEITDKVVGKGATAKTGDTVTVDYTGWLMDGTKFDSSVDRNQPFSFPLGAGQVIPGWDQGVAGMKVGGTRVLVIPASLAYGDQGAGGVIPPGATLKFEVKLLKVAPPAK
jgi:FKBP-type peptidyl-prolyl cis-trans isomerase FkpA